MDVSRHSVPSIPGAHSCGGSVATGTGTAARSPAPTRETRTPSTNMPLAGFTFGNDPASQISDSDEEEQNATRRSNTMGRMGSSVSSETERNISGRQVVVVDATGGNAQPPESADLPKNSEGGSLSGIFFRKKPVQRFRLALGICGVILTGVVCAISVYLILATSHSPNSNQGTDALGGNDASTSCTIDPNILVQHCKEGNSIDTIVPECARRSFIELQETGLDLHDDSSARPVGGGGGVLQASSRSIGGCSASDLALLSLATKVTSEPAFPNRNYRTYMALAALFYATDGVSWTHTRNWLSLVDHCDWYGIQCHPGTRHVTSINAKNNNLNGFIPTEVGYLSDLGK